MWENRIQVIVIKTQMDKQYLKDVWNSVWEEGLTEQEVQKLYFEKLEKKLKGEDRYMLKMLKHETKIKDEYSSLIFVSCFNIFNIYLSSPLSFFSNFSKYSF